MTVNAATRAKAVLRMEAALRVYEDATQEGRRLCPTWPLPEVLTVLGLAYARAIAEACIDSSPERLNEAISIATRMLPQAVESHLSVLRTPIA